MIGAKITWLMEKKGYRVAWLSRTPRKYNQKSFAWDLDKMTLDRDAIQWADAIIHLAGEGVADKRWTAERKKEIIQSRTHSTQLLHQNLIKSTKKPAVIVSASGINYYGSDTGDVWMDEQKPNGSDFLSQVVVVWEEEAKKLEELDIRTVILRTGIVLDTKGGALKEMLKPPIAAPLGSGNQWMSWIQIEDLARMYAFAIENEKVKGIYNAVGPNPTTNRELTKRAAKKEGKPFINIGVPGFGLKLVLGELADIVLGGIRVSSRKIEKEGFEFRYPTIEAAIEKTYNAK